jgi:HlyD family secretion protein
LLRKLLLVLIPFAGIVTWLLLRGSDPPEVAFAEPSRETLVSTLNTNGKVEPVEWAAVRAEMQGPVAEVHVQRGQMVQKGQLLLTLGASDAQAELVRAQSRVNQARAELETLSGGGRAVETAEIESGIAKTMAELETARRELETVRRLADKKAATTAELNAAREAVQRLELQIRSLERKRASLVTEPDRKVAQARLQEAQSAAAAAVKRVASTQVRSPMTGVLYAFDIRPGAYLNAGDEVARVGRLDQLRVVVYVDEPELGRVEKAMPVTISWDALPGREWKGKVESVPLQVVTLGTRQVGEVICTIENPDLTLIPGTNVNAEIRSKVVPNALTIPKEALRREGDSTGVLKLQGEKVVWQKVRTGVANVTRIQVVEGLSEGDRVALPVDAPLKSGDEVRPVAPRA